MLWSETTPSNERTLFIRTAGSHSGLEDGSRQTIFIRSALADVGLGFEKGDHGVWSVYFHGVRPGQLHEEEGKVHP